MSLLLIASLAIGSAALAGDAPSAPSAPSAPPAAAGDEGAAGTDDPYRDGVRITVTIDERPDGCCTTALPATGVDADGLIMAAAVSAVGVLLGGTLLFPSRRSRRSAVSEPASTT